MTLDEWRALRGADLEDAMLAAEWFAVENDTIGGWSVMPADVPPSTGVPEVACFVSERSARHIAGLHNASLPPSAGKPLRRAGAVWRLLVHRQVGQGPRSDLAYDVRSDRLPAKAAAEGLQTIVLAHTEFDELAVGKGFLHVEQMSTGQWWMDVAGVRIVVDVDRDGRPTLVCGWDPGEEGDPVRGCVYRWNNEVLEVSPVGGSDVLG